MPIFIDNNSVTDIFLASEFSASAPMLQNRPNGDPESEHSPRGRSGSGRLCRRGTMRLTAEPLREGQRFSPLENTHDNDTTVVLYFSCYLQARRKKVSRNCDR